MTRRRHAHQFHLLWCHFGPYGPQDVHWHPCAPEDDKPCDRIIVGAGRACDGKRAGHDEMWLGEQKAATREAL